MGRHRKVTCEEVLEVLMTGKVFTIRELADRFSVSRATIQSRLRELRKDGEAIIHNQDGVFLIHKDDLHDVAMARTLAEFYEWLVGQFNGAMICAQPVRPFMPAMVKTLRVGLNREERRLLGRLCLQLKATVDFLELQEEFATG